jgi:hypothetical protein
MGIRDKKKSEHGSVRMDPVSEVSREQVAKEAEEILASTSDISAEVERLMRKYELEDMPDDETEKKF